MAGSCSRILVMAVVALLASGIIAARGAENGPLPKILTGDDFFIPGKPIIGYLTVEPRYTIAENKDGTSSNYFSLRRLKLRILGELQAGLDYYVQGIYKTHNYSPTDDQIFLQEARVMWKFHPSLTLQVGQFKPPMGLERFIPDEMLYLIDRSQVTDHLVPNGNLGDSFDRDYGIELGGKLSESRFAYAVALMGGNGANNDHLGERGSYLLDGALIWHPWQSKNDGLDLKMGGAVSYRRNQDIDLSRQLPGSNRLGYGHFDGTDTHFNVFLDLAWGPASFQGEGFYAIYNSYDPELPDIDAQGFYVQAAYFLNPRWQAAGRYEEFDPNVHVFVHLMKKAYEKEKKMDIKVLGPGCAKCKKTEDLVKEAVAEAGVDAQVEKVTNLMEIAGYGVFGTPAVVVDGEVKCVGKIPTKEEIKGWIS